MYKATVSSLIACLVLLTQTGTARAQYAWSGTTSGDWQDEGNWNGGAKPTSPVFSLDFGDTSHANITGANDSLTFNAGYPEVNFHSDAPGYTISGTGTWNFNGGRIETFNSQGQTIQLNINSPGAESLYLWTPVAGGSLTIGALGVNTVNLGTGASLVVEGDGCTRIESSIVGAGGVYKYDNGILTLSGNNAYTGGTFIYGVSGGAVRVSADNNLGDASGELTLLGGTFQYINGFSSARSIGLSGYGGFFDTNGNNATLSGVISGDGALNKLGLGTLNLTGNNSYTGPTNVMSGTLLVNGSLLSCVSVGQAGTLGGSGAIGGLTVDGFVTPGNSIGTLTVNGDYTHNSTATYFAEINDHGGSDLINATGTATLSGGTVSVQAESGTYTPGMTYRILQAASVTGTFSSVVDSLPFLNGSLFYGTDYVDLILVRNGSPYVNVAQTQNEFSTAGYLDALYTGATGDLATVMVALDSLTAPDARAAFNQLSGEPYADLAAIDISGSNLFTDTAFYRLYNAADLECAAPAGRRLWAYALGNWERQRPTSSNAGWDSYDGYSNQIAGFMIGYDKQFDNFLFGFGAGNGRSDVRFLNTPAIDRTDLFNFSLYSKADFGAAYLAAVAGYTHGWNDMNRDIQFDGLSVRHATGTVDGSVFGSLFQAGYNIEHGRWRLTPIAGLRYVYSGMTDAAETGADSVNLVVAGNHRTSVVSHLGSRLAFCMTTKWRAETYAQWEREFADAQSEATMAFAGSPGMFTVQSAAFERDAAHTGIVAIGDLNKRVSLRINYDALLRTSYSSQQLTGGLSLGF